MADSRLHDGPSRAELEARIELLEAQLHEASQLLDPHIGHNVGLLCVAEAVKQVSAQLREQTARANIWEHNYAIAAPKRYELIKRADAAEAKVAELEAQLAEANGKRQTLCSLLKDTTAQRDEAESRAAELELQLAEARKTARWFQVEYNKAVADCKELSHENYGLRTDASRMEAELAAANRQAEIAHSNAKILGGRLVESGEAVEKAEARIKEIEEELAAANAREEKNADFALRRTAHEFDLATAEAERDGLRKLLRQVEWEGEHYDGDSYRAGCVCCGGAMADGHKPGCELSAALKGETE